MTSQGQSIEGGGAAGCVRSSRCAQEPRHRSRDIGAQINKAETKVPSLRRLVGSRHESRQAGCLGVSEPQRHTLIRPN